MSSSFLSFLLKLFFFSLLAISDDDSKNYSISDYPITTSLLWKLWVLYSEKSAVKIIYMLETRVIVMNDIAKIFKFFLNYLSYSFIDNDVRYTVFYFNCYLFCIFLKKSLAIIINVCY